MKINKILLMTLIVGLVAVVACSLANRRDALLEVEIAGAKTGSIEERIPVSGRLRPVSEVKLSPDVSGEIVELHCQEGDYVRRGQLLAKIRQEAYISAVERSGAGLGTARSQLLLQQANVARAESAMLRMETLFEGDAASLAEYESCSAELKAAQAEEKAAQFAVQSAEAQLREANEELSKTLIYSPASGVVTRLSVEVGERVVGTSQMAGTEMLRIADLSAMELLVEVGENDVIKIAPGAKAWVRVDACPENQIVGKVVKIANSASDEVFFEGVANFAVKIELGSTGKGIRPGMSASASILAGMRDSVVTVPIQSVFYNNGKEKIWVLDQSGKVRERIVTTGLRDLSSIEIISGLEPGEKIVTAPYSAVSRTLYDGCPVAVKE